MKAVAIDGPAGAGKSTIARAAAKELGFIYVDTGALYRAIGWYALQKGKDPGEREQVCPLLSELSVELKYINGEQRVFVNDRDVSGYIRTSEVSMAASKISVLPEVREFLFDLQRDMAKQNDVVMDGRDIGTVVLPWADVKIFLTASPEERARRRYEEMVQKGQPADYEEILSDVKKRDYNDSHRKIAPLKPAEGAVLLDTTGNTLEKSIRVLTSMIKERLR